MGCIIVKTQLKHSLGTVGWKYMEHGWNLGISFASKILDFVGQTICQSLNLCENHNGEETTGNNCCQTLWLTAKRKRLNMRHAEKTYTSSNKHSTKGNHHIPTVHFQVRFAVSFREGNIATWTNQTSRYADIDIAEVPWCSPKTSLGNSAQYPW